MISYTISAGHYAGADHDYIGCRPDTIDRIGSAKICCTNLLTREGTHYLFHAQSCGVRECLANTFLVNILIRIHADYEPITCIPPFLQLFNQIISKLSARTGSILLLGDEVAPMLLVACLGSFLIIIARIVSTDDASHYPF